MRRATRIDEDFECPPEGNEIDSMAKAYQELERLEAEIETVLALHRSGD